uniref:Uncharacterized protein n=1 Tax=Sinocyclocheilus grahami TaxID=75366 RepID=A0A672JZ66_SINGR
HRVMISNFKQQIDLPLATSPENELATLPHKITNIDWISCKDFTIEIGEQQIRRYMDTWEIQQPGWLYSLRFLQETELEFKTQYQYETKWSIPTRVPQPQTHCLWTFTERSRRIPGQTGFRGKWLMDITESKALLMDTVYF